VCALLEARPWEGCSMLFAGKGRLGINRENL
jgi:hypothetical protein